ncbi:hypothetical protein E9531_04510 [Lampropedia puyangensis]|uniref:Uncharacterized protein n=1 Tax=Lampropedia puyangensis TaxID=1330072 RepID=A0A4S8FBQ7_9BURK|nr:hypothetical protein [Lampropedia puyangensis]THU03994.1 hypothetical protein E9531_04510 [Lampropedia puyangensis]
MFALLSHFHVAHFNALQSKDIITPVPIHAAVMLGHAIGARLAKPVRGTALIVHHAQVETENLPAGKTASGKQKHQRLLSNKRGATAFYVDRSSNGGGYASTSRTPSAMAYQMHATANGCFSLALDFGEADVTEKDIADQLSIMRFAGGTFQSLPKVTLADTYTELLGAIGSGYVVADAAWRAQEALDRGEEPAHVFLHRHSSGYVMPATVGYHLITAVAERRGMRKPPHVAVQGHAFAESVMGLIELVHINRLKFADASVEQADADDLEDAQEDFDWSEWDDGDAISDTPTEALEGDLNTTQEAISANEQADSASNSSELPARNTLLFWQHGWSADQTTFLIQQR